MARRAPGKVIKVLKYRSDSMLGGVHADKSVDVPLRLVDDDNGFEYVIHMDDPYVRSKHKNPDECRKKAFEQLDNYFSVAWEEFFEVKVRSYYSCRNDLSEMPPEIDGEYKANRLERSLSIKFNRIQIGKRRDGKIVHRYCEQNYVSEQDPRQYAGADDDTTTSYIPATKENEAALKAIIDALEALSDRVRALMAPDTIEKTLLAGVSKLLPEPPPK